VVVKNIRKRGLKHYYYSCSDLSSTCLLAILKGSQRGNGKLIIVQCSDAAKCCDNTNFNDFAAATSHRKSDQFEFVRLVAATKFTTRNTKAMCRLKCTDSLAN